jgi:hypothetical protein
LVLVVVKVQITGVIVVKSEKSIELLDKSVSDELAAVHQYMYFHFHLDDLGFTPLATLFKRTAIAYALARIEPALYRCDCFLWSLQTGAGRADSRSHRILVESTSIGEMFEVQS